MLLINNEIVTNPKTDNRSRLELPSSLFGAVILRNLIIKFLYQTVKLKPVEQAILIKFLPVLGELLIIT